MVNSRYPKGLETRNAIIAEAKKVFYEKGYYKATITEICQNTNILGGTFTYYFKKKTDITHELYGTLLSKCYEFVEEHSERELSSIQKNVYSVFLYYLALFRDEKTVAFHYEILLNESVWAYMKNYVTQIYRDFNEEMQLGFTENEIKTTGAADVGIRRELSLEKLRENNFKVSVKDAVELAEDINVFMGRVFKMDENLMRGAIEEAKEFIQKYDYSQIRLLV